MASNFQYYNFNHNYLGCKTNYFNFLNLVGKYFTL